LALLQTVYIPIDSFPSLISWHKCSQPMAKTINSSTLHLLPDIVWKI
jgi:hypothetical protein